MDKTKDQPDLSLSLFPSKLKKKKKKTKCHIKKPIHPLILGLLEFHADCLKAPCRVPVLTGHL